MVRLQELFGLKYADRRGKVMPLHDEAAQLFQLIHLCDGFHAFRDDFKMKRFCQCKDQADDGIVTLMSAKGGDKRLVYLENVDGKFLQIGKRGIAGSEIVQRKP